MYGMNAVAPNKRRTGEARVDYHADNGCEVARTCLECPLSRCKFDDMAWFTTYRRLSRDFRIAAAIHSEGLSIKEAAPEVFAHSPDHFPSPQPLPRRHAGIDTRGSRGVRLPDPLAGRYAPMARQIPPALSSWKTQPSSRNDAALYLRGAPGNLVREADHPVLGQTAFQRRPGLVTPQRPRQSGYLQYGVGGPVQRFAAEGFTHRRLFVRHQPLALHPGNVVGHQARHLALNISVRQKVSNPGDLGNPAPVSRHIAPRTPAWSSSSLRAIAE